MAEPGLQLNASESIVQYDDRCLGIEEAQSNKDDRLHNANIQLFILRAEIILAIVPEAAGSFLYFHRLFL